MIHTPTSPVPIRWLPAILTLMCLFGDSIAQGFNVSSIALTTRREWCTAQINTCPLVCNSAGSAVTDDDNTCNPSTLEYTCTCVNSFSPDMNKYTETVPYFECQQVAMNCVEQNPNDLSAQQTCEQEQEAFCGSSDSDVTSVYHVTQTASDGSKTTQDVTLTLVEAAAATTSSKSSSTSSSRKSSSSSTHSTPATSTGVSPSTSSPTTSSKSGISTGALAAAIAVPIVGVVLIALGLGIFLYRKRKQRSSRAAISSGFEKAELHGEAVMPHEMSVPERFEMDGEGIPGEMQINEELAHEMGTNSPVEQSPRP